MQGVNLRKATEALVEEHHLQLREWIEETADDVTSPQEITERLHNGDFEMWFPYDGDRWIGMVITCVVGDTLVMVGAGGDVMKQWAGVHKVFVKLAKLRDCNSYEFRGRRGFLKCFKEFGMTEKYTVMECKF